MNFCSLELDAKEPENICITLVTPGILLVSSKLQPIFFLSYLLSHLQGGYFGVLY